MKLFGKQIKTLTVEKLQELCTDWKAFAEEPVKYKDTVAEAMVVEWINN